MFVFEAVLLVKKCGLDFKVLNAGRQLNIKDLSGLWHSYYPSTGSMVFNKFDDRSKKITLHYQTLTEDFINEYFKDPDRIQNMFKEEE